MERKKIIKRIKDCLNEMYTESNNVYGIDRHFTFDEINEACKQIMNEENIEKINAFVFSYFYLPRERHDELLKQAKKGIRYYWTWPRRTKVDENGKPVQDEEWEEYHPLLKEMFIKLDRKEITRKEFNQWENEMAKKYNMVKRSMDAETVTFNVCDMSPTSSEENFKELKKIINDIKDMTEDEVAAYTDTLNSKSEKVYVSEDLIFCKKLGKKLECFGK